MKYFREILLICIFYLSCTIDANAADISNGSRIYAGNCEICHADNGRGTVPDAPDFRFGDGLIKPDTELFKTISSGKRLMPGFQGMLNERDILDVIGYIRSLNQ